MAADTGGYSDPPGNCAP